MCQHWRCSLLCVLVCMWICHFLKRLLFMRVSLCVYVYVFTLIWVSSVSSCLCVCLQGSPSFRLHWGEAMCKDAAHPIPTTRHTTQKSKHWLPLLCIQLYYMSNHAAVKKACKHSSMKIWHIFFLGIHCCQVGDWFSFYLCRTSWGKMKYHCTVKDFSKHLYNLKKYIWFSFS